MTPSAEPPRHAHHLTGSLHVPRGRPSGSVPVLLVVAIVLVALNLRTPLTAVPPLLGLITRDLGLSGVAAGALTTLPVLAMGVCAPLAGRLRARFGPEPAILAGLSLVGVGTVVRMWAEHAAVLYGGVLVTGAGIAIAGTLLPGVVKRHFHRRTGLVTGIYTAAMMAGAAVAAQTVLPLTHILGGWPPALAIWSLLAVAGVAAWAPLAARRARPLARASPTARLPWRSATAWVATAYLTANSVQFYTLIAWLPTTFEQAGRSTPAAASLLTVFTIAQAVAAVGAPALADRVRDRRVLVSVSLTAGLAGTAGVAYLPALAPAGWVVLMGLGLGASFAVGLVLLVDYAATPADSVRLTAMAFLISYTVAAAGPVIFGALWDATAAMTAPWTALVVVGVAQLALVPGLRPDRPVVAADSTDGAASTDGAGGADRRRGFLQRR